METVRLGKTEIVTNKNGFGALPIQRIPDEDAVYLLKKAYDNGITYFDTARWYTDSEHKIGLAFAKMRDKIYIATKTGAQNVEDFRKDLEISLQELQTEYIDLYQFHNPAFCPRPKDGSGLYEAMLEAKEKGMVRHIGITNHRLFIAREAIASGNFETLQFPFCYLTTEKELGLVEDCEKADMGYIAMKGLSGGLLNNAEACYAFMQEYPHVVPIWGIQHEWELDQWLELTERTPRLTPELRAVIEADRKDLAGSFCRSCGYCLPCAAGIDIPQAARMSALLRRSPYQPYMSDAWHEKMHQIENCVHCGACKSRCPYGLDTPNLLVEMLKDYDAFYAEHRNDA